MADRGKKDAPRPQRVCVMGISLSGITMQIFDLRPFRPNRSFSGYPKRNLVRGECFSGVLKNRGYDSPSLINPVVWETDLVLIPKQPNEAARVTFTTVVESTFLILVGPF